MSASDPLWSPQDRPGHSGTCVGMEAFVANKVRARHLHLGIGPRWLRFTYVTPALITRLRMDTARQVGSLFTSDAPMSWVGVTLKHGRMIIPSHYSLGYHDVGNDMFAPRSWELQVLLIMMP
jgi:hypothetical protein